MPRTDELEQTRIPFARALPLADVTLFTLRPFLPAGAGVVPHFTTLSFNQHPRIVPLNTTSR